MMYGYEIPTTGWIVMLAAWALLIIAILVAAWLISRSVNIGRTAPPSPPEILRERFARGELTADEYEAARNKLSET